MTKNFCFFLKKSARGWAAGGFAKAQSRYKKAGAAGALGAGSRRARGPGATAPLGCRLATEPHRGGRFAAPRRGGAGARQLGFRLATEPKVGGSAGRG